MSVVGRRMWVRRSCVLFCASSIVLLCLISSSPLADPPPPHFSLRSSRAAPTRPKPDEKLVAYLQAQLETVTESQKDFYCPYARQSLGQLWRSRYGKEFPGEGDAWDQFYANIDNCDLYRGPEDPVLKKLLHELRTADISSVSTIDGGTQIKVLLTFGNGKQAIGKPMRRPRDSVVDPNMFYFSEFERHNAEIAAFHLDKVLGLRHVLPTTGRRLDLRELRSKAEEELEETFFKSPSGNLCFTGTCKYYCDSGHPVCGSPREVEFSVMAWAPESVETSEEYQKTSPCLKFAFLPRERNKSPFRRTYSKATQKAEWQRSQNYCAKRVKRRDDYSKGRRLLDLSDIAVFDFLSGNQDRHHYEVFKVFPVATYPVFYDNGRGFGRPYLDDADLLAPIEQCCVFRPSLLRTLLRFYTGKISLAMALQKSMKEDPVYPVLAASHLEAVDRRVEAILRAVGRCLEKASEPASVLRDSFDAKAGDGEEADAEDGDEELAEMAMGEV